MKLAVLFAVILFVASVAHAAFASGERLAQGCGKRDMAGEFFCMAYISGVLDSNPQCGPYPFSLREAMGMVATWLAADPARKAARAGSCHVIHSRAVALQEPLKVLGSARDGLAIVQG